MIRSWLARLEHPYILLSLTALFWSGNAIAGKAAVNAVPPMAFTFLRWFAAALILALMAAPHLRKDWPLIRKYGLYLFVMGAVGFAAFNLLLYNALHTTSALNVTIEQSAMPMIIMLFGFIAFREPFTWVQALGSVLSIIGVAVTVSNGDLAALMALKVNTGDALMVAAALVYSAYTLALRFKPALHWLSFLTVLAASAALTCLPFFVYEMMQGILPRPSLPGAALVLYVAVFPSILSQLFFARGVGMIGAGRAGMFINLVPLFAAVLAIILLGEQLKFFHIAGFTLIMLGIWLGAKKRPSDLGKPAE